MKIREIMKRTMAIGLATAMLLQSQSVVTLAETVQADAAETVVVDVGEETSVSGNGNDESEVDFSYEQGVPNEYTNRTILSENDVNIVEIDDDGYVYDESFYDDIEAEESSTDEVKSAITNYVSQLNGKFPTNYKNKAWQCYAFCNYVVSNVMGIDFFSNCITKKNGKWQSTDKLVEFLNKYAKPGDNIWGKGGHNMILMGWNNQGLYITDGMKNGNVWHNNKFISFSGKEWKNYYYGYFSAGYRLYSINNGSYKVINYGSNPVDKPPVINIAPAKPEVGAIAVSRSQEGEISYSAPVGVGAGASSGIVTISNSSGESYEYSCAIVNGQISGVVQIGRFQNTNTVFSIRVTVTDSYGCRAENMTQIDNTTTYTINATELTLKVGESFQFQGTTNTNLKVISEAWDYSTSTSDGEKRFGLQITPTGYVTAEKPGTYTVNYDSVIEQTSGGSTVQTKHRCSCVLKVYLDTPVINNVEFVNNRVEIDFVPVSGAEGYYIVWSEGENGSTNEKYKPIEIKNGKMITDVIYWEGVNNYQIMAYATSPDGKEQTSNKSNLSFVEVTDKYPHAENLQAVRKENKVNVSWDEVEGAMEYYVVKWGKYGVFGAALPPYEIEETDNTEYEFNLENNETYIKISVIPKSNIEKNNWKNTPQFFNLTEYKSSTGVREDGSWEYIIRRNLDHTTIDQVIKDDLYSKWAMNEDHTYDVYLIDSSNNNYTIIKKKVGSSFELEDLDKNNEGLYYKGWEEEEIIGSTYNPVGGVNWYNSKKEKRGDILMKVDSPKYVWLFYNEYPKEDRTYKAKCLSPTNSYGVFSPEHICNKDDMEKDWTNYSYVYFGSYPQSEVTQIDIINSIDKGLLQKGLDTGDVWVNGTKYRKISCNNTTDAFNYNTSSIQSSKEYRYFKWERIRWRVLETVGGKMKLMADMALDCQPYNVESKEITWKESTIRSWLNSYDESQNDSEIDYTGEGFINTAFSGNERDALIVNEITDKAYGDDEGSATSYVEGNAKDKVGLLSKEDAFATEKYGFCIVNKKSNTRCLEPTPYAYVMGCATYSDVSEDVANCFWWTRSTYDSSSGNAIYRLQADCYGKEYRTGVTDTSAGVVPAITINMKDPNWKLEDDETSGNAGENDPYYPIEYNLDGGNNSLKNPSSYRLNTGLIELENPQKIGYQFKGWYTDKEYKKQIKCIDTSTAGKIKLYAQWEKVNNNIDVSNPASTSIYTYEVLSDGTIRITSCQTSDINLVIPDTIDGYTVTEIGANAFANQTSIQTVKFPANLKQIGVKAFANCTGLLEVTLPDTIQGAGQLCFSGCTALKKAVLNKGRINIVYGMFENCTSLTEVVIPDTVENVAMYAFLNCRSLTHLNLPASLKSISVHAFEGAGVTTITYAGTKAQWQKVKKNLTGNGSFVTATVTDSTGVSFAVSGSNNGNQNPQQTVKKPGKVKITKAKNVKTKKLTVKWKKTSKAKGYQIQIASNKKFTKGKKTKTLSKTTYSFKKLKKNKYYYVRVRAYVYNSNHKKVYGSWSAVKKVKIKK